MVNFLTFWQFLEHNFNFQSLVLAETFLKTTLKIEIFLGGGEDSQEIPPPRRGGDAPPPDLYHSVLVRFKICLLELKSGLIETRTIT